MILYARTDGIALAYRKGFAVGRIDAGAIRRPPPGTYSGKQIAAWRQGYRDAGARPASVAAVSERA